MNTTNRPARALPWITNKRHEVITAKDFHGVANFREDQDAAYAVHACNAYPKLMEALRNMVVWSERIEGRDHPARTAAQALLAECEEG
jgi:hypothetical protein